MSTPTPARTVVLSGRPGGTTHRAVEVLATLPPELRLIGGLAVLCRVGMPHRATVDLDAVTRDLEHHDATIRNLAVTASGGGQYQFAGELDLDVIEVAPSRRDRADRRAARRSRRAHRPRAQRRRALLGPRQRHSRRRDRGRRARCPARGRAGTAGGVAHGHRGDEGDDRAVAGLVASREAPVRRLRPRSAGGDV